MNVFEWLSVICLCVFEFFLDLRLFFFLLYWFFVWEVCLWVFLIYWLFCGFCLFVVFYFSNILLSLWKFVFKVLLNMSWGIYGNLNRLICEFLFWGCYLFELFGVVCNWCIVEWLFCECMSNLFVFVFFVFVFSSNCWVI